VLGLVAGALAAPAVVGRAQGGSYPDRPIRLVVPYPPGGGTDTWARLVSEGMQPELGQTIVIENRGGASGMVGAEVVAKAVPDGYTLLFHITTHVQAPVVLRRFPYNPIDDFAFIGRLGTTAITFCIGPAVPAEISTLAEFVAWGRGRDLSIGNYGPGSSGHAFGLLLAQGGRAEGHAGRLPRRGADAAGPPGRQLPRRLPQHHRGGGDDQGRPAPSFGDRRARPRALARRPRADPARTGLFPPLRLFRLQWPLRPGAGAAGGLDRLVPAFRKVATAPETLRRLHAIDTIPGYEDPATFRASAERTLRLWQEMAESLDLYATT
jgi:tripartite-type tricarboxylate transporter receptor subunit TctC